MKKRRNKTKKRHRNSAGAIPTTTRRRGPPINRAPPPDFKTAIAAAAASVGSSLASGLLVNQKVMDPETVSMLMAGIGGVGAYLTGGNLRVACSSIASVGAGQYALAKLGKAALKHNPPAEQQQQQQIAPPRQAQLLAPPEPQRPQSATGGGFVVDMFRDAANDLELIAEDEWRYGARDADPGGYVEVDLDEAA